MTQETALEVLKKGHNVFLTGPAGSGKTYLLNRFIDYCRANDVAVAVTASTGIAATHMDGITIHSWCGLGVKDSLTEADIKKLRKQYNVRKRIVKAQVLVIDEISMLHAYQLDIIDKICRLFKNPFLPFGGLQVVLCGDFFQLPPVSRMEGAAKHVVSSQVWSEMDLKVCYLELPYRQKDKKFIRVLREIRERTVTEKTKEIIFSRLNKEIKGFDKPTKLFTHNADADAVNIRELNALSSKPYVYRMQERGEAFLANALKKGCLAPERLVLKEGAVVMFVKNNFEEGYVNGTLGKVVRFTEQKLPVVETYSKKRIAVTPQTWVIDEDEKVIASLMQLPLRLAWAITVHKSQGMTLDAVEMDLSKAFEHGMGYVALSRARSLNGIKLLGLNEMALEVDPIMFEADVILQQMSTEIEKAMSPAIVLERSAKRRRRKE